MRLGLSHHQRSVGFGGRVCRTQSDINYVNFVEDADHDLIVMFLAKTRREPKHQLHTLDFVQPIAKCGVEFFFEPD